MENCGKLTAVYNLKTLCGGGAVLSHCGSSCCYPMQKEPGSCFWLPELVAIDFWTALLGTGCFLRRETKQAPCQICMALQRPLAAAAALQDAPLPPSKEGAQKICMTFAWTSRERRTSRALSLPLNTACLSLLGKTKSFWWLC